MPDETRSDVARTEDHSDWEVLNLLIDQQRPWSVEELAREIGDRIDAIDSVARLHGAELIHRTGDGFAFITRAAAGYYEIAE
jgi:predicted transcriptional regulator